MNTQQTLKDAINLQKHISKSNDPLELLLTNLVFGSHPIKSNINDVIDHTTIGDKVDNTDNYENNHISSDSIKDQNNIPLQVFDSNQGNYSGCGILASNNF